MKVHYPGLLKERLPSGNHCYRVRKEGSPRIRIPLHVAPDHKDFVEHYRAARAGIETPVPRSETPVPRSEIKPEAKPSDGAVRGSVA